MIVVLLNLSLLMIVNSKRFWRPLTFLIIRSTSWIKCILAFGKNDITIVYRYLASSCTASTMLLVGHFIGTFVKLLIVSVSVLCLCINQHNLAWEEVILLGRSTWSRHFALFFARNTNGGPHPITAEIGCSMVRNTRNLQGAMYHNSFLKKKKKILKPWKILKVSRNLKIQ